jgi:hypothetical protein
MPIDTAALATTVVGSFLLPYVKSGVEKISEEVGKNVSKSAADYVTGLSKKIWERVKAAFTSDRDQVILSEFKDQPEAARLLVETKLMKKLEQDAALAEELDALINAPGPFGLSSGAQIMNSSIAGILDARGADFSGSQGARLAGVMLEKFPPGLSRPAPQDEPEDKF